MAPELQLLVSQLSSSLELPFCTLELELLKLVLELQKLVVELCKVWLEFWSAEEEGKLLRFETESCKLGDELCRLVIELLRLTVELMWLGLVLDPCWLVTDPCNVGEERLEGQRGGRSSPASLHCAENTGHEAVEEQELRSCLFKTVLDDCCPDPLTVTPRPIFDDLFCIFGPIATLSKTACLDKWTMVS